MGTRHKGEGREPEGRRGRGREPFGMTETRGERKNHQEGRKKRPCQCEQLWEENLEK